eukprot:gene2534-4939_t
MLYHVNDFRRAVYMLPHTDEEFRTSMTLTLQNVFANLQNSTKAVTTKNLTRAFGWNSQDAFTQQDVQEMMRVLLDKLEEKMKGTAADGVVKKLFAGRFRSFVQCVHVNYESAREEDFYDLQLDVKGCRSILDSFRRYTEQEDLDGDNKYDAGELYGKQAAKKGIAFTRLPHVLTIHLKRFNFEMSRMAFTKIHDYFEFPLRLDLNEFVGDVNSGHYYAYIRPSNPSTNGGSYYDTAATGDGDGDGIENDINGNHSDGGGKWFKFDDEQVSVVTEEEAVRGCYGRAKANDVGLSSAYMLIMKSMCEKDLPSDLQTRLEKETIQLLEDEYNRKRQEMTMPITIFTEDNIKNFHNYSKNELLIDYSKGTVLHLLRGSKLLGLILIVSEVLKIDPYRIRIREIVSYDTVKNSNGQLEVFRYDLIEHEINSDESYYIEILPEKYFNNEIQNIKFYKVFSELIELEKNWKNDVQNELKRIEPLMGKFDMTNGCGIGRSLVCLQKLPSSLPSKIELIRRMDAYTHAMINLLKHTNENYIDGCDNQDMVFFKIFDPNNDFNMNTNMNVEFDVDVEVNSPQHHTNILEEVVHDDDDDDTTTKESDLQSPLKYVCSMCIDKEPNWAQICNEILQIAAAATINTTLPNHWNANANTITIARIEPNGELTHVYTTKENYKFKNDCNEVEVEVEVDDDLIGSDVLFASGDQFVLTLQPLNPINNLSKDAITDEYGSLYLDPVYKFDSPSNWFRFVTSKLDYILSPSTEIDRMIRRKLLKRHNPNLSEYEINQNINIRIQLCEKLNVGHATQIAARQLQVEASHIFLHYTTKAGKSRKLDNLYQVLEDLVSYNTRIKIPSPLKKSDLIVTDINDVTDFNSSEMTDFNGIGNINILNQQEHNIPSSSLSSSSSLMPLEQ